MDTAVGVLKEEMRRLGSLIIAAADRAKVPAGSALAVDRDDFSRAITDTLERHPLVEISRAEAPEIPTGLTILATGPLTSPALGEALNGLIGPRNLYFYDAIAPIVTAVSIDMKHGVQSLALRQGRRRIYQLPDDGERVRGVHSRIVGGGKSRTASVREAGLFRGMHANRGDGAARADDARVWPDAPGRAIGAKERPAPIRGRAASTRRRGRPALQYRRLPDQDDVLCAAPGCCG